MNFMLFLQKKDIIRILCTSILLFVCKISLLAQLESQFSQYMFHMNTFNPATIAENGLMNVAGQHRIQWVGMPGAPQVTYFTVNTPLFNKKKSLQGVGLKFLNNKIGAFSNQTAHIQYNYKRKIGKEKKLSIGADIGFVSVSFIADSIKNANVNSEFHDFMGDEAIPQSDETGMNLDLSLGAFYSTPKYYLGISYVHLNSPTISMNDDKTKFGIKGVMYGVGGYNFKLPYPKTILKSSALFKTDYITWQSEISSRVEYDKRFWAGLSYRYQDAMVIFAGLNVINGLTIGYAYDFPIGKMLKASSGSHELLLKYSFLIDFGKNNSVYKSIRFL